MLYQLTLFQLIKMDKIKHYLVALLLLNTFSIFSQNNLNLSGQWQVKLDPENVGLKEHWWFSAFSEKANLPGSLAENNLGNDITLQTPWVGDVIDSSYFFSPKYAKYRSGDLKIPFWLKPKKSFVGVAWYKRSFDMPQNWSKKRIILHLERCHWESSVFVNGNFCGTQNSLVAPHDYDITDYLKAKGNSISIRVDNSVRLYIGPNSSSITDHTQTNWNGVIGNISLQAQELIHITDIKVFPRINTSEVEVKVLVEKKSKEDFSGKVAFEISQKNADNQSFSENISISSNTQWITKIIKIANLKLWDEFNPNLYTLAVSLTKENQALDTHKLQFGMREVSVKNKRIHLNNRPIFLRGDVDCAGFPLTGYPSMERAYWEKIGTTIKNYGLNHLRFHSWCPPEVAFQVADSLGIYLYVEGPLWANQGSAVGTDGLIDQFIFQESERVVQTYGNHPSFIMMSYGNEPAGSKQNDFFARFVKHFQALDTRHLYTSGAGWPMIPESDFHIHSDARIQRWGEGVNSIINAKTPSTTYDWSGIVGKIDKPYISHEIGQWCAYPNLDEIAKYKGVLRATNFEIFKETLEENGMGDQAKDFLYASGRLQTLCYKADIEAALRTPNFGGFQLLGLHDFSGQGTALVGALDAFWESKGYTSGDEYRQFCNSTVLLARIPKLILTNQENFEAALEIAHFGAEKLLNQTIQWRIQDESGKVYQKGSFVKPKIQISNNQIIGNISVSLKNFKKAQKFILWTTIAGTTIHNSWEFWVYPSQVDLKSSQGNVLIAEELSPEVMTALEAGKNVLLLTHGKIKKGKGAEVAIGFSSIFWNTAWTSGQAPHTMGLLNNTQHPIFKDFPTEKFSNYQWQDMLSHSQVMLLNDFPKTLKATIQPIDTWFENRRLSLAFEAKVGKGKLMVCSIDLVKDLDNRPSARQFKYSLLKYLNSKDFNPTQNLETKAIQALF